MIGPNPNEELMDSMHELFSHSAYSDLIILCGNEKFHVHKAIVCPRANFFAARIDLDDAKTVVIQLPQEDLQYVKLLVHYLYHLAYCQSLLDQQDSEHRDLDNECLPTTNRHETLSRTNPPNLTIHVKVYCLAEKFGVRGLKALALNKFAAGVAEHWDRANFSEAVHEAYKSTTDSDRALRDVIVQTLYKNLQMLSKEDVWHVVCKFPLGRDLLEHMRSCGQWWPENR